MMQRFMMRDAGCVSRLVKAVWPGRSAEPNAWPSLNANSGVISMLARPADAVRAEQRARPLDAVDQRHRDDRAGRDRLVGPDLDVAVHDRSAADRAAAADDRALVDGHAVFDECCGRRRYSRPARTLRRRRRPPRRSCGAPSPARPTIDESPRTVSSSITAPALDDHVLAEHDGRVQLRVGIDAAALADPHAGRNLPAGDLQPDDALERVVVRLLILLQVPDVGPVAVGRRGRRAAAVAKHLQEQVAREIVLLAASPCSRRPRARGRRCRC